MSTRWGLTYPLALLPSLKSCSEGALPRLSLEVTAGQIQTFRSGGFLEGEVCFGEERSLFLFGAKDFSPYRPQFDRLSAEEGIDLFEYLPYSFRFAAGKVGLVTFQNGVQNSRKHFHAMGQHILARTPGNPLLLGLYNPTEGLEDFSRAWGHFSSLASETVVRTYAFMTTMCAMLRREVPLMRWLHIMHSEAGGIGHVVLDALSDRDRMEMRSRLITAAYGPQIPTSDRFVLDCFNTYSDKDYVTGPFLEQYKGKEGYEGVKVVECLDEDINQRQEGLQFERTMRLPDETPGMRIPNAARTVLNSDHAFTGETYTEALIEDFININKVHPFI